MQIRQLTAPHLPITPLVHFFPQPFIPLGMSASYALSGEEKKARAAGCDDYVPKPFSPRQLLPKIRQHLT